ncbi:MAG: hypothetical protein ABFS17_01540 [Chloroflexota bacterium]
MNISKNSLQNSVRLICASLLTFLIVTALTACSPQVQPESVAPSPTPQSLPAPTQTPIPTPIPTALTSDGTVLLFEKERYIQDEYCSRKFDYLKTAYGTLTIAIADSLVPPQDSKELIEIVIARYNDLEANSPAPISRPLTVMILSNPKVGGCYSRDHLVFAAPEDLGSKSFFADLLGAGTGISEYWVKSGLASIALGEQPDQAALKTWYQNTADLDIAGLFIARFNEDWTTEEERQIAHMSAASLVQYALEEEHIQPELLKEQVNNEVRTRWLASLGVDRTVTYPYAGRFSGFVYSQSSDCALIVQADPIRFCLNKLPDQEYLDEISKVESFIDHVYAGRKLLAEFLISDAPSIKHLMNLEEATGIQIPIGHTHENKSTEKYDAEYYLVIHEIFHSINFLSLMTGDAVWVTEGFGDYLLKQLPLYRQIERGCIFDDLSGRLHEAESSISPGTSYCYYLDVEQVLAAKEWYLAQGGLLDNEESIDIQLYTDAVAFATIYREASGDLRGLPLGEVYENRYPRFNLDGQDGLELSITQAASFFAWLCDTYSLDLVLDVYFNHAEEGVLDGKSYEELKALWLADLIAGGEGIKIPEETVTP